MKLMTVYEYKLSEKLLSLHRALAETDKLPCAAWWDFFPGLFFHWGVALWHSDYSQLRIYLQEKDNHLVKRCALKITQGQL